MNIAELKALDKEALRGYISDIGVLNKIQLAYQGVGLDILVNDQSAVVRKAVAKQGYGLDALFYDENIGVRNQASMYLVKKHISLKNWINENHNKCCLPENQKIVDSQNKINSTPTVKENFLPSLMEKIAQANKKRSESFASCDEVVAKAKQQADKIFDTTR